MTEAAEEARTLKEMTLALQDRMGAEAEAAHICLRNQLQLCVQSPDFPGQAWPSPGAKGKWYLK